MKILKLIFKIVVVAALVHVVLIGALSALVLISGDGDKVAAAYYHEDPGWHVDGMGTYQIDESGERVTGWTTSIDGFKCFLDENGYMVSSGEYDVGEDTFLFDDRGRVLTGWQIVDGEEKWFGKDGKRGTGLTETDSGTFYLDWDGTKFSGEVETSEGTYTYKNGKEV